MCYIWHQVTKDSDQESRQRNQPFKHSLKKQKVKHPDEMQKQEARSSQKLCEGHQLMLEGRKSVYVLRGEGIFRLQNQNQEIKETWDIYAHVHSVVKFVFFWRRGVSSYSHLYLSYSNNAKLSWLNPLPLHID